MTMRTGSRTAVAAAVAALLVTVAVAYPGGAPQSTCGDLTPKHGPVQPQSTSSPYELTPAVARVTQGGTLRLRLTSPQGEPMKGFMIQARNPAGTPVGSFSNVPADVAKTLTCGAGIRNTLTHINKELKKSVEVEWEPPTDYDGSVVFHSTFVKDGGTFWVGTESEPVQVVKRAAGSPDDGGKRISTTKIPIRVTTESTYTAPVKPQGSTSTKSHAIYTGCGDTKTCFGFPDGCASDGTCDIVTAVSASPAPPYDFTFELLSSSTSGYVAVALSKDDKMGDDQVVQCTSEELSMSNNVEKPKNQMLTELAAGVEQLDLSSNNGQLYCRFKRAATTTVSGITYDLRNTKYYLMVARGTLRDDGKSIGYHDGEKLVTASALNLSEVEMVEGASNLLYRLHGAFMIIAWIGCAGTGMLFARYFKKTWVGKQACGKDIWFATHRGLMVMTWLLTNAAFIIIFVQVGGWYTETSNPHAVLGVITTALCFIQPIAANFRPAPSDAKRPYFNWSHWGVGNLAQLLAIITIFYARKLSKSELPEWNDYIVATYVAFYAFMHILFSVTDYCSQRSNEKVNSIPMKEMGVSRVNTFSSNLDAPLTCLRRFLLAVYLLVVIGLTVALVVIAVIAPIEENETFKQAVSYIVPSN